MGLAPTLASWFPLRFGSGMFFFLGRQCGDIHAESSNTTWRLLQTFGESAPTADFFGGNFLLMIFTRNFVGNFEEVIME